jgi:ATP-dependent Clp protease adaptor protein ClpS
MATDITIDEKIKKKEKVPNKYKVIFLNDDLTPMNWVVKMLCDLFKHTSAAAEQITMTVHLEGSSVAGVYSHEVAEQKMAETVEASRNHGFPLGVIIEEDA